MIRREILIGVISSADLHRGVGNGYMLLFTNSRIVGANRPVSKDIPESYCWTMTESSEADHDVAERFAAALIGRKQFELSKEGIFKILYEAPGIFLGGRVIFASVGEQIQVETSVLSVWNPSGVQVIRKLVESLLIFAPDRFYDEKTGALVRDVGILA
ncbi:MAG: hypothetical protein OK474_02100 [Thaumarchaeota archaeon]|nr:hypothetical protein [Nitrososphaerota archaeon]